MKTKRKMLLLSLGAVSLVTASVLGTRAYLTSADTVENTFTIGSVAITLDEAEVNEDGTYVNGHNQRVDANEYHLLPGHTYIKDPTVTIKKGSEESYVRMVVTINEQADLEEIFETNELTISDCFDAISSDWTLIKPVTVNNDDTCTYEFRYKSTVAAPDADVVLDDLFEKIMVPGSVAAEQLATIADLEIDIVAHAIQADGFADANAAWTAFDGVNP